VELEITKSASVVTLLIEVLTDQLVAKSRSVVFSTRRKLGHGVAFYEILTLEAQSIAKKRNLSKEKQPCTSNIPQALY